MTWNFLRKMIKLFRWNLWWYSFTFLCLHKFEILKYRKYDFLIFFYLASFVIQVENRIVDRMCVKFATFSLSKSYIANVDYKNVVGRYKRGVKKRTWNKSDVIAWVYLWSRAYRYVYLKVLFVYMCLNGCCCSELIKSSLEQLTFYERFTIRFPICLVANTITWSSDDGGCC